MTFHLESHDKQSLASLVEKLVLELALEVADGVEVEATPQIELNDLGFDSVNYHGLAGLLSEEYGLTVSPTMFFEAHTPRAIARYLVGHHPQEVLARHGDALPTPDAASVHGPINEGPVRKTPHLLQPAITDGAVAIVGMAAIMPKSPDLDAFWRNLAAARDLVDEIPPERWDWRAVSGLTDIRWGAFISGADCFDAPFFMVSPVEAEQMDPQQRIFLETAWKALEDAGLRPSSLAGSNTGVFVGAGATDYWDISAGLIGHTATGGSHAVLANRLSYLLDLRGPSEPVDTACSSSLVAIHRGVQAIQLGDCDLAVAGGVNLMFTPSLHIALTQAGMLSREGKCKTFSADADGYVRGEGVAAVVLKPLAKALEDGNPVHAVIRGTAVNHGGRATSLTAPNPAAQADLIVAAWRRSGLDPSTAGYIEAHGTGTVLGDPIEIDALKRAFGCLYRDWGLEAPAVPHCGLGSVKTNAGHLEAAAGIAGLLKVVAAMKHGQLPASLHSKEVNPLIDLTGTPFHIVGKTAVWRRAVDGSGQAVPYRAGVSSFGFGGTNAHIVLEAFDRPARAMVDSRENLFVLSARDEERLKDYAAAMLAWLDESDASLADICHTARHGREPMKCRLAFVVSTRDELRNELSGYLEGGPRAGAPDAAAESLGLHALAAGWRAGEDVDWSALPGEGACVVSMPTYPFARLRYWNQGRSPLGRRTAELLETARAANPDSAASGSSIEDQIASICRFVLGHAEIDRNASLGEMGADSILAAQIHGRIAQTLNVRLPLGAMIEAGTVGRIAAMVEAHLASAVQPEDDSGENKSPFRCETAPENTLSLAARPAGCDRITAAQRQFVFLDLASPNNPSFNLPGAIRIDGPFSVDAAVAGFRRALQHHEILRARFAIEGGEPVMSITEDSEAPAEFIDVAEMLPREKAARADDLIRARARIPFDLAHGPLCRLLIVELGDEDHIVLLTVHHIVSDIASVALLLREVASAGQGGRPADRPAVGYADYALWEGENLPDIMANQLPYWREKLGGLPPSLSLPFDKPRPQCPTYRGAAVGFELDATVVEALSAFARQHQASPFVVLLAAFKLLLHRLSDSMDIAVGCPYANRSMPGTADMIGCLAYALIMRTRIEGHETFASLVAKVRQTVHEAFDHLYVPYTRLVEDLNPERKAGINPLFQSLFNVIPTLTMPPEWSAHAVEPEFTDYDLSVRIYLGHKTAKGALQFASDVFDRKTAELIAEYYGDLIRVLVEYPEIAIDDVRLPENLASRKTLAAERFAPRPLRIASTFTDRLLADGLAYWGAQTGRPLVPDFAGYNRLFQELLDPAAACFSLARGGVLFMTRTQDWLRFADTEDAGERLSAISEMFDELADSLETAGARISVPALFLLTPSDPAATSVPQDAEDALCRRFADRVAKSGIAVGHWREVAASYPVDNVFDAVADEAGHVPYTREYFAALASYAARWMDGASTSGDAVWKRTVKQIVAAIDGQNGAPTAAGLRKPFVAPETDTQRAIVEGFAATLGIQDIGIDDSFFDLGGHSLSAIRLLSHLGGTLSAKITVVDVFMAPTPRELAERITSGGDDNRLVNLAEAAVLAPDIIPLAAKPVDTPQAILLTGATGFVGRFLLRELLDCTDARIYCLLRCAELQPGAARLRRVMERWSLWREGDEGRIVAVCGDLNAQRLGLSAEDHATLCREVDAIYHNATSMNHLETFATARKANVDAVQDLLRIAATGRPKVLNYVSTLAVFSAIGHEGERRVDEATPIDFERHLFANGYTTSKWAGEQLVHLARQRGVPSNVFRLGLVTGDAAEGRYDELQSFHRLLKSCIQMGAAFEGFRYDLVITPVNYVARGIVDLGGRHSAGGGTFHLSSMRVTPMEEVFRLYNAVAEPQLTILPHREWLEEIRRRHNAGETLPIMPLVHAMLSMDGMQLDDLTRARERSTIIFDCTRTERELAARGIRPVPFDADLLRVYLKGFLAMDGGLNLRLKTPAREPECV